MLILKALEHALKFRERGCQQNLTFRILFDDRHMIQRRTSLSSLCKDDAVANTHVEGIAEGIQIELQCSGIKLKEVCVCVCKLQSATRRAL